MARKKRVEVHSEMLTQRDPLDMGEIGNGEGIEKVAATDHVKQMALEAFMNEKLEIIVQKSRNKEDLQTIVPSVNGRNQPIFRGKAQIVKRKYVEVLARWRNTRYEQITDPLAPEKKQMVDDTSLEVDFRVLHDPNPVGEQWLTDILAA